MIFLFFCGSCSFFFLKLVVAPHHLSLLDVIFDEQTFRALQRAIARSNQQRITGVTIFFVISFCSSLFLSQTLCCPLTVRGSQWPYSMNRQLRLPNEPWRAQKFGGESDFSFRFLSAAISVAQTFCFLSPIRVYHCGFVFVGEGEALGGLRVQDMSSFCSRTHKITTSQGTKKSRVVAVSLINNILSTIPWCFLQSRYYKHSTRHSTIAAEHFAEH